MAQIHSRFSDYGKKLLQAPVYLSEQSFPSGINASLRESSHRKSDEKIIGTALLTACFLLVSACGSKPPPATSTPEPTATDTTAPSATWTVSPTGTSTPTQTSTITQTPQPSVTPLPTLTPSVAYTLEVGEPISVMEGGFSIRVPSSCDYEIESFMIHISEHTGMVITSFSGMPDFPSTESGEETFDAVIEAVFSNGNGQFQKEVHKKINQGGGEGYLYDISGTMFANPVHGQGLFLLSSENQFLMGLSLANLSDDASLWHTEGRQIFNASYGSLEFLPAGELSIIGACPISVDTSYGYTQANPIRVGGDWFDGPSRERAFLDNLLGPNGESITYERQGSVGFEDTILDIYEVTIGERTEILYLDMYLFSEPQAPVGFTCKAAFPLSVP